MPFPECGDDGGSFCRVCLSDASDFVMDEVGDHELVCVEDAVEGVAACFAQAFCVVVVDGGLDDVTDD